ncbi:MAG: S-methyl-5-thioribose-1-phosphate isomerase, partial [Pirellulaceae bacterium]
MTTPLPPTLAWEGELPGRLLLIDQTKLPAEETTFVCETVEQTHDAIRRLVVRGAPAIGIAAAYGVVLAVGNDTTEAAEAQRSRALQAIEYLATSRPTAVNLFWALDRMRTVVQADPERLAERLLNEARAIHEQDRRICRAIGEQGVGLLRNARNVLTHCNAGALAASELGTALAVFYAAHQAGQALHVFADETRPLLQGARLTAWELNRAGIPVTVICDSMAGAVMQAGKVDAVVVGADRIAANGDAANKIGTYAVAVLAKHHNIPFYVAAPISTFDLRLSSGAEIPIEVRDRDEIAAPYGKVTVADGIEVFNPAFDVTPAELITGIITEKGTIEPVDESHVRAVLGKEP